MELQVKTFITSKCFFFLLGMLVLVAASWVSQVRELQKVSNEQTLRISELDARQAWRITDLDARQTLRITELEARQWNGKFKWKIVSFEKLFSQSKSGAAPLFSPSFYTGVPGYKMRLKVYLNGHDSAKNTHISMFVYLMVGEFDSLLQWPFTGTITLTVTDQSVDNPQHVSGTLEADPSISSFQRPQMYVNNDGYGYSDMISYETLQTRNYIKDDAVILKVEVQTSL